MIYEVVIFEMPEFPYGEKLERRGLILLITVVGYIIRYCSHRSYNSGDFPFTQ